MKNRKENKEIEMEVENNPRPNANGYFSLRDTTYKEIPEKQQGPDPLELFKRENKKESILLFIFGCCIPLLCFIDFCKNCKNTQNVQRKLGKCGCFFGSFICLFQILVILFIVFCLLYYFNITKTYVDNLFDTREQLEINYDNGVCFPCGKQGYLCPSDVYYSACEQSCKTGGYCQIKVFFD